MSRCDHPKCYRAADWCVTWTVTERGLVRKTRYIDPTPAAQPGMVGSFDRVGYKEVPHSAMTTCTKHLEKLAGRRERVAAKALTAIRGYRDACAGLRKAETGVDYERGYQIGRSVRKAGRKPACFTLGMTA